MADFHKLLLRVRGVCWVQHVLFLTAAICVPASAQWMGKQTGCPSNEIRATPNRPTVSNTAHITQYGVLEVEYGWDRMWPAADFRQTSTGGMLKFGMLCDIELHWITTSFVSQLAPEGSSTTAGDQWFGSQIRFHRQQHILPSMSLAYGGKVPVASTRDGVGSGHVDHTYTFGASEDLGQFTFDFNATRLFAGRSGGGFDKNEQLALAGSHPVWRKLDIAMELYGATQLNRDTPAFASSLGALTYSVLPRLVFDGGYEAGITADGPHRHVFFGATYSIVDLYHRRRTR